MRSTVRYRHDHGVATIDFELTPAVLRELAEAGGHLSFPLVAGEVRLEREPVVDDDHRPTPTRAHPSTVIAFDALTEAGGAGLIRALARVATDVALRDPVHRDDWPTHDRAWEPIVDAVLAAYRSRHPSAGAVGETT